MPITHYSNNKTEIELGQGDVYFGQFPFPEGADRVVLVQATPGAVGDIKDTHRDDSPFRNLSELAEDHPAVSIYGTADGLAAFIRSLQGLYETMVEDVVITAEQAAESFDRARASDFIAQIHEPKSPFEAGMDAAASAIESSISILPDTPDYSTFRGMALSALNTIRSMRATYEVRALGRDLQVLVKAGMSPELENAPESST